MHGGTRRAQRIGLPAAREGWERRNDSAETAKFAKNAKNYLRGKWQADASVPSVPLCVLGGSFSPFRSFLRVLRDLRVTVLPLVAGTVDFAAGEQLSLGIEHRIHNCCGVFITLGLQLLQQPFAGMLRG